MWFHTYMWLRTNIPDICSDLSLNMFAYNMTKIFRTGNWQCHIPNIRTSEHQNIPSPYDIPLSYFLTEYDNWMLYFCRNMTLTCYPVGIFLSYLFIILNDRCFLGILNVIFQMEYTTNLVNTRANHISYNPGKIVIPGVKYTVDKLTLRLSQLFRNIVFKFLNVFSLYPLRLTYLKLWRDRQFPCSTRIYTEDDNLS